MSTVPCDQIMRSTWTFRIKRNRSTNEIIKFKARFCADGARQEFGVNYNETHAPVVKWVTMQTCLTLSIPHKWHSRAIDLDQAHTQAECDTDIYLHPPAGYNINSSTRYVLKLIKNLCGLKQGRHNFYEKLRSELINPKRGFVQSQSDPCVFYKKGVIVLCYVDNCLTFAQDKQSVNNLISSLQEDFLCTDEGPADGHLGVEIKSSEEGMTLKQPQLIRRIIELLHLTDANSKPTPVVKPLLSKNVEGKERENDFHYRSAVGSLSYLSGCTRTDVSMAVHQAAKFSSNPRRSHDNAIKLIGKCLKGTADKGIICKPNSQKGLKVYVDAYFAGSYDSVNAEDPASVYSRTGFIILLNSATIFTCSKKQRNCETSSFGYEFISMKSCYECL